LTALPLDLDATTFASLGVPSDMVAALRAQRITSPFPIQAATIPDALAGRDLCGRAPTGSGKTVAFGIPLVHRVSDAKPHRPTGLVLVPTRELAAQVCAELRILAGRDGPRVEAVYGGVGFDKQLRALRGGVEIIVACPGRLADLAQQGNVRFDAIEVVVLDEADRMADMGFLPEVRRLLDKCPDDRQTLLFSATLDGDVDVLIERYQRDPVRHDHGEDDEEKLSRADHYFWAAERPERVKLAAQVIDAVGPTIVFSRTKRGADRLARQLTQQGVHAAVIHGDRSQGQRERALESFHRGKVDALVATDVAARGIHVDGVAGVIHFDAAADHKDYVHRSGRTARAGAAGVVVTFVHKDVRSEVKSLQRALGFEQRVTDVDLALIGADPDAPPRPRPVRPAPVAPVRDDREGDRDRRNNRRRPRAGGQARSTGKNRSGNRSAGTRSNGTRSDGARTEGARNGGARGSAGPARSGGRPSGRAGGAKPRSGGGAPGRGRGPKPAGGRRSGSGGTTR
jgi:superfamily II DNA/RNA helicase